MKSGMVILFFLIVSNPIFSQVTSEYKGSYQILDFQPEDFSRNLFIASIRPSDKKEGEKLFSYTCKENDCRWTGAYIPSIYIGDIPTEILKNSIHYDNGMFHFKLIGYRDTFTEKYSIKFQIEKEETKPLLKDTYETELPPRNSDKNKQPLIEKLDPAGGIAGDSIIVQGKFFGDSVENIVVKIYDPAGDPDDYFREKEIDHFVPTHLFNEGDKTEDKIRFTLDSFLAKKVKYTFWQSIFGKKLDLKLISNYRSSNTVSFYILPVNFKWKIGMIAFFITLILIFLIWFILKNNSLKSVIIDSDTGGYSLSKFQGSLWTVVLVGSYIYIAISKSIILKSVDLPDFNASLIVLLGISYGGWLSSGYLQSQKKGKNKKKKEIPQWKDLFETDGQTDLSRIQLFIFTIVTVILYLFNLTQANVLVGLPDIPATLHGLLTASQAGYLSGKMISSGIQISKVLPEKIDLANPPREIQIFGNGFSEGSKIIIEGLTPVVSDWQSPNEMKLSLTELPKPGKKKITIVPQTGNIIEMENAVEFLDLE